MEHSHSWQVRSPSAIQEIPHILPNSKVYKQVSKSLPLVPMFSWTHTISACCLKIHLSYHPRKGLPSGLFSSDVPTKTLHTFLFSSMHASNPSLLFLLNLFTHTILGEQHQSWSSSLCSFLHPPTTSSLLGPHISTFVTTQTIYLCLLLWLLPHIQLSQTHSPLCRCTHQRPPHQQLQEQCNISTAVSVAVRH